MVIFNKVLGLSRNQYLLFFLLVLIEVVITIRLCSIVKRKEEQAHKYIFEAQAQEITASIQKQISVNLEKLISLDALYDVSYPVSKEDFSAYTRHLISPGSSIKALSWIPRVSAVQRNGFERNSREAGDSCFSIVEKSGSSLEPAGSRKEYFPVRYIEPVQGNEAAMGFDLASCKVRRTALEKAALTNQMVVTEPIRLVQSSTKERGVLVFFPFRKDDKLIGYFSAVFSMNDLVVRSGEDFLSKNFNIFIFDTAAEKSNQLLTIVSASDELKDKEILSTDDPGKNYFRQTLEVADRKWLLEITPSQYYLDFRSNAYWLILFLCIAISVGLCYHLLQHFRSENLLLNILPESIANELKKKGSAEARDCENVSILFTDFKGFTEKAAGLDAQTLVDEINVCYQAFDTIVTKYGIEKIKTIGDAYMAAGGLPESNSNSVRNTVLAALEMQMFIRHRKEVNDALGKPSFEMRAGVHTGPVVAGIVGQKKFQYDVWGDTVNIAKRMESAGKTGHVNISQATYEFLKYNTDFDFEHRCNAVEIGKKKFETWIVRISGESSLYESFVSDEVIRHYSLG